MTTVELHSTIELLQTITTSLEASSSALPADITTFLSTPDGISLLDAKNDILLSYLQHLVFLLLLRLRRSSDPCNKIAASAKANLRCLRAYLDRGIRPLETRLKYQIDKVLRAAEDSSRQTKTVTGNHRKSATQDDSDLSNPGSESEMTAADSDEEALLARPNPSALTVASQPRRATSSSTKTKTKYIPPRINPVAMPSEREPRRDRTRTNALLNEFVAEEHSSAPLPVSSIGANQTARVSTTRSRQIERERRDYEEANFTRLPGVSKKEKQKERARERATGGRDIFGGEDWTGLGGLGERLGRDVGSEKRGKLDRRRQRKTVDGPRGDGVAIGERFEKRRKILEGRAEKRRR